jgi:limonene 1,2-monooxygenase
MDANALRLVGPMHIAETREQARANVQFGLYQWADYFGRVNPNAPRDTSGKDLIDQLIDNGGAIIGTPDDAIAKIEALYAKQGDFGAFLQLATNWADWESTKKSYELFARYVRPHFTGANKHRRASLDYVTEHGMDLAGQQRTAALKAFAEHEAAQKAKAAAE